MMSFRVPAALALVAGVVGVAAVAGAAPTSWPQVQPPAVHDSPPIAEASGGDAAPTTYPSIVNVRLVRAEAALARAATWVDQVAGDNARDDAIAYIHSIAPPVAGDGRVHPQTSGGAIAPTWDTFMPNAIPLLDDEIQEIKGTLATNTTLSSSVRRFLRSIRLRDVDTRDTINQYWPPLPADG
jgi:hypothetical protein